MLSLITVYIDSEKTDYYGKFSYRYAAAKIIEYILQDNDYKKNFLDISKQCVEDFSEFCNLIINDLNSLLMDGLIALREIKSFEDLRDDEA
jgi:ubiquitin conjugation factor E4 B